MRRSALFSLAALAAAGAAIGGSQEVRREGDRWVRTVRGSEPLPAGTRLKVSTHGPVKLVPGSGAALGYEVSLSTRAGDAADAWRRLGGFAVRIERPSGWVVLAAPHGSALTSMTLTVPRGVRETALFTSDGAVEAGALEGRLRIESAAGPIRVDRAGDCRVTTGGGGIKIGTVEGSLTAMTGGGSIAVQSVRGEASLETAGGDITVENAGGALRATTVGGSIKVVNAGSTVVATTGGGSIAVVNAKGIVTARNAAGPVHVGAAAGLRCEAGTGAIRVSNITGGMRVSTAMGSIMASLLGAGSGESSLATGNGDITVLIPSNLGVTVRAENEMADTIQRIVSEFPGIPVRLRGSQVVAEGPLNGGGPLLRISGTGGTIFIKRQQ